MLSVLQQSDIDNLNDWLADPAYRSHIVVGAGAAGSVVAARLAENPGNRVLVVEMGPNNYANQDIDQPTKASLLWEHPDGPKPSPSSLSFETSQQLGRYYTYPRGTGAGGSSNHHSMVDGRGHPVIYDNIAKLVDDPVWSYDNILPYFKKMESYHGSGSDGVVSTRSTRSSNGQDDYHGHDGWLSVQQVQPNNNFSWQLLQAINEVTQAPIRNDMSGDPQQSDGVGLVEFQVNLNGSRCYAFADLLIPTMTANHNLIVIFNSLVTKVVFDYIDGSNLDGSRQQPTTVGVEILHGHNLYLVDRSQMDTAQQQQQPQSQQQSTSNKKLTGQLLCTGEVILAGGAINTPQLLLLSGVGPAQHLTDFNIEVVVDSPQVGANLMDHHEVNVVHELDSDLVLWPHQLQSLLSQISDNPELQHYLSPRQLDLIHSSSNSHNNSSSGGLDGAVVLDWYSGLATDIGHDLHMDHGPGFFFDFDLSSNKPLPDGKVRVDYMRAETNIHDTHTYFHSLIEVLRPSSANGQIKLASADPTVPPVINLALYEDDEACERIARGILTVREIFRHPTLAKVYKQEIFPSQRYATVEQLKTYIKRWSSFGHHIAGTAAMSTSLNQGVVDSRLRVHGVRGLRVVDNSIYPFPYLHGYNVSRGAYLIGELAADFIADDY